MDNSNKQEIKPLGVVLCGGESRRMGTDKGLICQDGAAWAEIVFSHLQKICDEVVVSIHPRQAEHYYHAMGHYIKDFVFDKIPIFGPLAGILSVHDKYPNRDLFVLACDMVKTDYILLEDLWKIYQKDDSHIGKETEKKQEPFSGYLYSHGGLLEPLCAIYRHNWLRFVYQSVLSGQETQYQVKYYFTFGKFYFQEIDTKKERGKLISLSNLNTPEDINLLFVDKRKDE